MITTAPFFLCSIFTAREEEAQRQRDAALDYRRDFFPDLTMLDDQTVLKAARLQNEVCMCACG
jgi:hypothetical protein